MKIIYVHHANRKVDKQKKLCDDISLIGKKDAKLLSKLFNIVPNKEKIKAIYAAPSVRCTKTAQIINKRLNIPIIFGANDLGRLLKYYLEDSSVRRSGLTQAL